MKEGMKERTAKGMKEEMKEGMAKGREEERINNARKMKAAGISPQLIAEITGLHIDEIVNL